MTTKLPNTEKMAQRITNDIALIMIKAIQKMIAAALERGEEVDYDIGIISAVIAWIKEEAQEIDDAHRKERRLSAIRREAADLLGLVMVLNQILDNDPIEACALRHMSQIGTHTSDKLPDLTPKPEKVDGRKARWASMSDEEKQAALAKLREARIRAKESAKQPIDLEDGAMDSMPGTKAGAIGVNPDLFSR